jgi:carboxymethylenebutenolidase
LRRFLPLLAMVLLACLQPGRAAEIAGVHMSLPAKERPVQVTYFRAPGDNPRPAALLLHGAIGFDSRIADYNQYASELANHGIDAYLVYYYSAADERAMFGGANIFADRYAAWTRLVSDVASDVLSRADSNGRIGLIGFSNGGILATGVGARDPAVTAAVIYYGTRPWPLKEPVTRLPPLLILHGDADTVIPVEQGRQLADLARQLGGTAELEIYPGERHGFGARLETANGADGLRRALGFLEGKLIAH